MQALSAAPIMNKACPLLGNDVKDLVNISEFVKDRLYFASLKTDKQRHSTAKLHFFSSDETYVYLNFFGDFGPICLSTLYRYCNDLENKLKSSTLKHKVIIHNTGPDPKKRLNAAFLIGCYAIIYLKWTPSEVHKCLQINNKTPYIAFQDASEVNSIYTLELLDCFNAVHKARGYNLFDFQDFDVNEMVKYEKIQYGDITWIVPNKLLAFSGPNTSEKNTCYHPPEFYLEYFRKCGVELVVRLNQRTYDEKKFTEAGISHLSLYFPDGSTPSNEILCSFIKTCERYKGPIAVHCKAGLGRTGCLIGAYLIKNYKMTAMEAIAWMRICRPGCVIGIQQDWLKEVQILFHNVGDRFRYNKQKNAVQRHPYGIYSKKKITRSSVETVSQLRPVSFKSGMYASQTNKENNPMKRRTLNTRTVSAALPTRVEKNFVLDNIKRPLSTFCRKKSVIKQRPESQADSLMQVKANKTRLFTSNL